MRELSIVKKKTPLAADKLAQPYSCKIFIWHGCKDTDEIRRGRGRAVGSAAPVKPLQAKAMEGAVGVVSFGVRA